jgi:hypothetical protein
MSLNIKIESLECYENYNFSHLKYFEIISTFGTLETLNAGIKI